MTPRLPRLLEASPALAALALNAVAHGRWFFNAPVMLALLVAVAAQFTIRHHGGRMLLAGVATGALGVVAFFLAPPPPGPIPPVVLSPLCLALVGLSAFCVLSQNRPFAWVYGWLLAVLSANVSLTPELSVALAALALASVLAVASAGRVLRAGASAVAGFAVFLALAAACTWQLALFIRASEGWLMETVAQLTSGASVRALEPKSVDLPTRTTAPLSMEALFELHGTAPHYLRTGVLEFFDGRRWWETQERREEKLSLPGGDGEAFELSFLAPLGRSLPAPAGMRAVEGAQVEVRGGWVLQSDALEGKTVRLVHGAEVLPEEPPPAALDQALPDGVTAELKPLADGLLARAATTRERAEALEHFFSANFTYSLTVDLKGQGHPLALLIRERRPAYCSYFASAMVALLRTEGVSARLVTGFAPAETNRFTGRTVVRQRDAHAWVEVYLPEEKRWAAFDPTPWFSRDAALQVERQQGVVGAALDAVVAAIRRGWARLRYAPGATLLAVAASPITWVLVAALALWVFRRRLRFGRDKREAAYIAEVEPRLRDAYRGYLKLLARAGVSPAAHQTDDELLVQLEGPTRHAAETFVQAFRRERFRAPEQAPLDEALHALERELERSSASGPSPRHPGQ